MHVPRLTDFRRACDAVNVEQAAPSARALDVLYRRILAARAGGAHDGARALAEQLVALVRARIEAAPANARARTGLTRRLLAAVCCRAQVEHEELAHYHAILASLELDTWTAKVISADQAAHCQQSRALSATHNDDTPVATAKVVQKRGVAAGAPAERRSGVSRDGENEYESIERRLVGISVLYEVVERLVRRADPLIDAYDRSLSDNDQQLGRARDALSARSAHVSSHSRTSSVCCPRILGCSLANELRAAVATLVCFLLLATASTLTARAR